MFATALSVAACNSDDPAPDAGIDTPPPGAIAGELHVAGCVTESAAIAVQLSPVDVYVPDDLPAPVIEAAPTDDNRGGGALIDAVVTGTGEPGVYRFEANDVPFGAYQIGVDIAAAGCESVVWRGPSDGLVFVDQQDIALMAVALRTHLEVFDRDTERWSSAAWVDADDTTLQFRVRSDLEDLVAFDIQVSTERFSVEDPMSEGFCDPPAGATSERMETPPGGRELTLDMSSHFSPPVDGSLEVQRQWLRIQLGAPVYMRAVPVTSSGAACRLQQDGASSWVRLIHAARTAPTVQPLPPAVVTGSYTVANYPHQSILTHNNTCFRINQAHKVERNLFTDPMGQVLIHKGVYSNGQTAQPGEMFCIAPSSGGGGNPLSNISEAFGDFVDTITDPIEWAVNKAAALYEEIKQRVISMVAEAIKDLTGCDDPCRIALEFGAEIALASVGLPPSLPDFDALVDGGIDYLAAELATQAGVPDFVAEQALELAIDMIDHAKATRGMALAPWLMYDTQFRGTVLRLDVRRFASAEPHAPWMWIIPGPPYDVWKARLVHIPEGAMSVQIPVALPLNFEGLPALPPLVELMGVPFYGHPQRGEAWYQTKWGQRRATYSCSHFEAWLGDGNVPLPLHQVAAVDIANAAFTTFEDSYESQCTP